MTFKMAFITINAMKPKRGRPKSKHPKSQRHLNLAYMHLLPALKAKLAPPGLEVSDGQMVDIAIATLHELLVDKGAEIIDPVRMLAVVNAHFKRTFSEFLVKVLTEDGRQKVETFWSEDGQVHVKWDTSSISIPAEVFARADANSMLRDLKTGALPS